MKFDTKKIRKIHSTCEDAEVISDLCDYIDKLEKALEFYAEGNEWDYGLIATRALKGESFDAGRRIKKFVTEEL